MIFIIIPFFEKIEISSKRMQQKIKKSVYLMFFADKDSHPNSPAGAKYNLNGTMTCDVREKIQKNRAEEKSIEQIKRERQKAKEEKYGPNRPRRNAKSLGPNAPGFKPGQFQREKRFQPKLVLIQNTDRYIF